MKVTSEKKRRWPKEFNWEEGNDCVGSFDCELPPKLKKNTCQPGVRYKCQIKMI